ncbi:hypothetical protein Pse7367_3499 [Thalassoporum mexicanum PCC 7367]|uniref:slr1658 superfamily regulator n=1 Tax=Thalassoporum mexicanum TaxID=3457544 RepID=UPI00029FC280|nr:hypothetical protein [Pseudanabaena sp. PCC 7367]AFY71734.1 hypothetical protein Pse7367_3499 [Pseudanabaena sp. PCC 7367]
MTRIYGSYLTDLPPCKEHLQIRFLPNALVHGHKWQHNGSSANFVAEYFATFFPYDSKVVINGDQIDIRDEVRGAVSYIANELLENAVKFNNAEPDQAIALKLMLYSDRIVFIATNYVDCVCARQFEAFINEITNTDPDQLYIDKLEQSAMSEEMGESGLGILTIINDYQAKIGWQFTSLLVTESQDHQEKEPNIAKSHVEQQPGAIAVTVMVDLPLPHHF